MSTRDAMDYRVSRMGGLPCFMKGTSLPANIAICHSCQQTTRLLMQIYAPFEDSPNDRVLYIFGCSNGACQGKDGRWVFSRMTAIIELDTL